MSGSINASKLQVAIVPPFLIKSLPSTRSLNIRPQKGCQATFATQKRFECETSRIPLKRGPTGKFGTHVVGGTELPAEWIDAGAELDSNPLQPPPSVSSEGTPRGSAGPPPASGVGSLQARPKTELQHPPVLRLRSPPTKSRPGIHVVGHQVLPEVGNRRRAL